jgi:hypothetical protein
MTNKEAIDTIKHAIAEVEWTYPMDYAAAFDKAVEALELLREQEAVTPIKVRQGWNEYFSYFLCPVCKNDITFHQSYCEDCGRKMKWDED